MKGPNTINNCKVLILKAYNVYESLLFRLATLELRFTNQAKLVK